MSILEIIIYAVVTSLCISIIVGAIVWHKLSKKHEEEVGMLKARIDNLERRWIWLEERYAKHEAKYHR
jgi:hypothetical protein